MLCVAALVASVACSEPIELGTRESQPERPIDAGTAEIDTQSRPTLDSTQERFYRGYLAERLRGDRELAYAAYEEVLEEGASEPMLAARAALSLAERAAQGQKRRAALDLAMRAAALGESSPDIVARAELLKGELSATRSADMDVRGPPIGVKLDGVSRNVARAFARAESLLVAYHRLQLSASLETLYASIQAKRSALEAAEKAYSEVTREASAETVAIMAAEFRIASLYHDMSQALGVELSNDFDPSVAAKLHASMRAQVREDRKRAQAAIDRVLNAYKFAGKRGRRWRDAAEELRRGSSMLEP